jgi:hypothetical protein
MTNHDRFVNVFANRIGRTFTTAEITKHMLAESDIKLGSILPNDHGEGNVAACWCAKNHSNQPIFEKVGAGLYRVRPLGSQGGVQPPKAVGAKAAMAAPGSPKRLVIDDVFIAEWHPKYDLTSQDEPEYRRLVAAVACEISTVGTIGQENFLAIWKWKGAMRVIGQVKLDQYGSRYAQAFRRVTSEPPERKLAALIAPNAKLPGVEAATGSTIVHFIHPQSMPIIDVRTVEVLFKAGLLSTDRRDLGHYEEFRRAIEGIRQRCPRWSLRQIDRALFAYHKQVLDKGSRRCGAA